MNILNDIKTAAKPNLMRVAREIASYEDPDRVLHALGAMLAAHKGTSNPFPKPGKAADNNLEFNRMLNSCEDPQAVYHALMALADRKAVQS